MVILKFDMQKYECFKIINIKWNNSPKFLKKKRLSVFSSMNCLLYSDRSCVYRLAIFQKNHLLQISLNSQ